MYQLTGDFLKPLGYQRYEISNYAHSSYASRHNLTYWRYGSYLGLGPGAHSRIAFFDELSQSWQMQSMEIVYNPAKWLEQIAANAHAIKQLSKLSKLEVLQEILMMGLRLTAGIDNANLRAFSGKSFAELIDANLLAQLVDSGLLDYDLAGQRLYDKGLALHSSVISKLFGAINLI
jgi:oxygen-independent coproporphyrinogen-3 oxidase